MDTDKQGPGADRKDPVQEPSRRQFLIRSGYALGGLVVGGAVGALIPRKPKAEANTAKEGEGTAAAKVPGNFNRALMFFTQSQFAIVQAAMERIYPEDDHGPGAASLGSAFFIDHQLAGDYGFNSRDYMSPPFYAGEKVQGYQGRLLRRDMYLIGLQEMDNYSRTKYQKGFASLEPAQQDEVLAAFQADEVKLTTISASGFFNMLRANTIEGAYSDPLYGGNADMAGWKMRNYPGNQMSYTSIIEKDFTKIAPQSLQEHMAIH